MGLASTIGRLPRLELITARLKSDDSLVVRELAREFGVSVRKITRDIQILRDQGLPVDADRGRSGGDRITRRQRKKVEILFAHMKRDVISSKCYRGSACQKLKTRLTSDEITRTAN